MKCLMPLNQRRVIAEACRGRDVVEWGCGGTTSWLLENTELRTLRTIEHDRAWLEKTMQSVDGFWITTGRWQPRYSPVTVGANATAGEEQDQGDGLAGEWYAEAGLSPLSASVFIVDGVLRSRCLLHATRFHCNSDRATVFIHDTQRDWYDDAIAEAIDAGFVRTDYPEGEDYPGCLLTRLVKE